ncbi:MAG TPA: DUF3857 domain-containing protein [Croceibacterium sp.]|nr:DUF3857 domain-containing protein [Croceibacterium sp.]
MKSFARLMAATALVCSAPVFAGDKVLYGPAPGWVSEASLDDVKADRPPAQLIADFQHRLESGVVRSYYDSAVRIDNSQMLMEQNTLSIGWLPDKGDLTVHRLEIHRDGEVIDLIRDGADFDVIRREQGLEARLLDGELSATLAIPGLRVGDVLRTAYSVSVKDQALGDEVQVLQYLGSKPWRVGLGRTIVSWPEGQKMRWSVERDAFTGEPQLRDGYRFIEIDLPVAEPKEMPQDAPSRYLRPTVLRVGSFDGWNELSRQMAPHYDAAAEVGADSEVAAQAAAIMRQANDPLERAALATRLVQDKVSYLLDGLDGGNYLPQNAEFTWEKRYGDCKAKSVLLLALLNRMGIDAEPVLVATRGGDALPELLPLPGDFDHVIIRASIGGEDYWLDGTSAATRLANIGDVPPFFHALPLRAGGADLMPIAQRDKSIPDMRMAASIDHSAGVDFPAMFTLTVDVAGPAGAMVEAMADADDPELRRRIAAAFTERNGFEGGILTGLDISYDKETGVGRFAVSGITTPEFEWREGKFVVDTDMAADSLSFNANRSRREWRDIPVATPGTSYVITDVTMLLPEGGKGFALNGPARMEGGFANTRLLVESDLNGAALHSQSHVWQRLGEVAPGDIGEARRQAQRIVADRTQLVPPAQAVWRWDLTEQQRRDKAAPFLAGFEKATELVADDDYNPLIQKAMFLQHIFEYEEALAVYDELVDLSPSAWAHFQRAGVLVAMGRRDDAVADLQEAYDLEPANYTGFELARAMGYAGRPEEALDLLDSLPVKEDERIAYADARATLTGLLGKTSEALEMLAEEVAGKPDNSNVLNSQCWFRGLFNVGLEDAISGCTRAVERSDNVMAALDSRAMVQYRLGNYDAAITDLNAALRLAPGLPESRYLRGVVRLKKGDSAGREDIDTALRMSPHLAEFYGRHGVVPAR